MPIDYANPEKLIEILNGMELIPESGDEVSICRAALVQVISICQGMDGIDYDTIKNKISILISKAFEISWQEFDKPLIFSFGWDEDLASTLQNLVDLELLEVQINPRIRFRVTALGQGYIETNTKDVHEFMGINDLAFLAKADIPNEKLPIVLDKYK